MRRRPLTICVVGSSASCHVVSRATCFADRGHRVFLITETRAGVDGITELVPSEVLSERLPLIRYLNAVSTRLRGRSLQSSSLLGFLLGFRALIRQCRPDIIHVHFAYSAWAWMATVVDRHPLVVSIMGGDILFDEQGSPTVSGRWLTLQLLESADLITAKSDYLIAILDRLGGFGAKAMKVVWGVDLQRFRRVAVDDLRSALKLTPRDRVILSPKILQRFYNVHLVIEAMPRILDVCPEARLLITEYRADKDYRAQIAERTQVLGLEKQILFVGHVPHAAMPRYYSLADVAVAVPSSDGLPQTLFEAMACGVPSVVSRLPRYEEIVTNEQSAYFVDITAESIADGVIRVLNDSHLRERMARAGRAIVESQANVDQEVERVEAKYYELLSRPSHRKRHYLRRARVLRELMRYWMRA